MEEIKWKFSRVGDLQHLSVLALVYTHFSSSQGFFSVRAKIAAH